MDDDEELVLLVDVEEDPDVEASDDDDEDDDDPVIAFGGEFKRLAIILFKVVLDVISDAGGFATKLLRVELAEDDEDDGEEAADDDVVVVVELLFVVFVLELLAEELCLVNTFCKLFELKISCNKGEVGAETETLADD